MNALILHYEYDARFSEIYLVYIYIIFPMRFFNNPLTQN